MSHMLIFALQIIAYIIEIKGNSKLGLTAKTFDTMSLILYQAAIYYTQA